MTTFDAIEFRRVLGAFPTGVVIVTGLDDEGQPLAMTVGSFVSVSLNPALVGFLPTKTSSSWAALQNRKGTRFGINVLASDQEELCRAVASRKTDKLAGFEWELSKNGSPILQDSVAFIDCQMHSVSDAGDHDWVMGEVLDLFTLSSSLPLLFFRGGYGSFAPGSMAISTDISVDVLHKLDVIRPQMERLSAELVAEVSVMTRIDGELVNVGSAGSSTRQGRSSRVGVHVPFMPPIGGVFAAFGGPEAEEKWLAEIHPDADPSLREHFEAGLARVRDKGYASGIGHEQGSGIEITARAAYIGKDAETRERLRAVVHDAAETFNTADVTADGEYEFHSATAPVFDRDGLCLFSMTVWGSDGLTSGADVLATVERLQGAADAASQQLKFRSR